MLTAMNTWRRISGWASCVLLVACGGTAPALRGGASFHASDRASHVTTPSVVAVVEPAGHAPTAVPADPVGPPPAVTAAQPTPASPAPVATLTATPEPVEQPVGPGYLQLNWAQQQAATAGGAVAQAARLRKGGNARSKAKDDASAVAKYEAALDLHATGQLYYDYANSLSNVNRLAESLQAYAIAIALGYEHPELALYDSACAHSRMQDADGAYAALAAAIAHGYYAFGRIEKDADLAFLRARDDFRARFTALQQDPSMLTGELGFIGDGDDVVYTVCPGGQVLSSTASGLDESCCHTTQRGELVRKDANVVIQWRERCGSFGTGGRKESDNEYEECQPYRGCGPEQCKVIARQEEVVTVNELAQLAATPRSDDQQMDDKFHRPFKNGVPKQCLGSEASPAR